MKLTIPFIRPQVDWSVSNVKFTMMRNQLKCWFLSITAQPHFCLCLMSACTEMTKTKKIEILRAVHVVVLSWASIVIIFSFKSLHLTLNFPWVNGKPKISNCSNQNFDCRFEICIKNCLLKVLFSFQNPFGIIVKIHAKDF